MDEQQKSNEAINIHLCIKCIARRQWNQKFTFGDLLVLKISYTDFSSASWQPKICSFDFFCGCLHTYECVCVRVCISLSYSLYR